MKRITLAAAQFAVTRDIGKNLSTILKLAKAARQKGARLVLFPECALSGYPGANMPDMSDVDPAAIKQGLKAVSARARSLGLYIACGTARLCPGKPGWKNSVAVFDARGRRVCVYDKTALTDSDKKHFSAGRTDPVFTIDGVRFGCQICFDIRFPEGYRRLFKKNVHVVLHSYYQAGMKGFWKYRRDIITAFQRVRASENGIYVVSSNTMGRNKGRDQWIPTMMVNPLGKVIAALKPTRPGVLCARIDVHDLVEPIEWAIRRESARQNRLKAPGFRPLPKGAQKR
jgi:NAD+ synthase (glutamine-hydrolysing)